MKVLTVAVRLTVIVAVICAFAFACVAADRRVAKDQSEKPGDVERGKKLFGDPKLGGGTSGLSCASCHKDGKGLENLAGKNEFRAMGKRYTSLEDVINYFVETALHGKAIDRDSDDMRDLIAYLRTLGRPASG
jgi:cytochrome c